LDLLRNFEVKRLHARVSSYEGRTRSAAAAAVRAHTHKKKKTDPACCAHTNAAEAKSNLGHSKSV
jgi:hypothetical protein